MQDFKRRPVASQNGLIEAAAQPRLVIENVAPYGANDAFAVKRAVGGTMLVECDIYSDGHDTLSAVLFVTPPDDQAFEVDMTALPNDRWTGEFLLTQQGRWSFAIVAWRDDYKTWVRDALKKRDAGQAVDLELKEGFALIGAMLPDEAIGDGVRRQVGLADPDTPSELSVAQRIDVLRGSEIASLMRRVGARRYQARTQSFEIWVDRKRAEFSSWYELMPRSQSPERGRHGTFDDVIARLPDIADLGFDVLYLTPIHPIGRINRKGRNNSLTALEDDPGSPYAIGSAEGGHDSVHPELGSLDDFARLVGEAKKHGLEIALDFAVQCAPDHPWIAEHPEWFEWRPDGTIRFAENPPKKYEDIVNVSFYGEGQETLWHALRDAVVFWIHQGVNIFRVDNPHTKPFPFWRWLIRDIQEKHPSVIFLSEAFTRPKIMQHLARLGFTQSYSYFTWRNTKQELTEYIEELCRPPARDFMRVNFFTNTPDINPYFLQTGGRSAFQIRLFLAAMLGTNYGIWSGFELCEAEPVAGKEEYLHSEKYELKVRDWQAPGNICEDVKRLNRIRRASPALQTFANVTFHNAWNDNILYFSKSTTDKRDFLLFAVNLDPHNAQGAHFEIPLWGFGLADDATIEADDLVTEQSFAWTGKIQHMWLDPATRPYMIWRLRPGERT